MEDLKSHYQAITYIFLHALNENTSPNPVGLIQRTSSCSCSMWRGAPSLKPKPDFWSKSFFLSSPSFLPMENIKAEQGFMLRFLGWVSEVNQCVSWTFSFWGPCSACVLKGDGFGNIDRSEKLLGNLSWALFVSLCLFHSVDISLLLYLLSNYYFPLQFCFSDSPVLPHLCLSSVF